MFQLLILSALLACSFSYAEDSSKVDPITGAPAEDRIEAPPPAAAAATPAPATEAAPAPAPENAMPWQKGPLTASLGNLAEFGIPADGLFLDAAGTAKFMRATGNIPDAEDVGTAIRKNWGNGFVIFSFSEIGYVKDDDKDKLDAKAILESITAGTEESNKNRPEGQGMHVLGWETEPHYDPATHYVEWAVRAKGESSKEEVVNYQIRMLGRTGVMRVTLVGGAEEIKTMVPDFKKLLTGFTFKENFRYAEYRPGDKIAAYGLTALVAGGAAAVALKSGLLQKFGKFILIGAAAAVGALRKFFAGLFGKKKNTA